MVVTSGKRFIAVGAERRNDSVSGQQAVTVSIENDYFTVLQP
jgi:hypothetical protein